MFRSSEKNLESAARHLLKADKFRSFVTTLLRYDVMLQPAQDAEEARNKAAAPNPWAVGDPRAPISVIPAIAMMRANRAFCKTVEAQSECGILPAITAGQPYNQLSGHPRDPFVEFPNGLILRTVAAAEYILETQAETSR